MTRFSAHETNTLPPLSFTSPESPAMRSMLMMEQKRITGDFPRNSRTLFSSVLSDGT